MSSRIESQVSGPCTPALLEKTIGQALAAAVAANPFGEALVSRHQGLRLTWRDLSEQARRTACGLWGLGVRPGDRVGVWASNCAEWIYLQIATALTGSVLVNVNPAYRSHELSFVLRKSGMKVLFLHEKDARTNFLEILNQALESVTLPHAVLLGSESWDRMLAEGEPYDPPPPDPDRVVNIQYTSGTTGSPKGVLLTHRNLVNNAWLIGNAMRVSAGDKLCAPVPMYHCFGCVMSSLLCLVYGIPLVLPAPQFQALATLQAVQDERCTMLYGVPTMFIAELEHPEFASFDLRSLRTGIMAGAPCPIEIMKRVVDQMHCREMTIAYGQTESSPVITMSATTDTLDLRVSTVGRALPHTQVKIVDPEGNTVEAGVCGELLTRGYLVMQGYDAEPEATARAIDPDGWLHTGDLATMRPDGCFYISGRLKDMIIRGGENIYPREIEDFLRCHPKIADVSVIGVPDARLGETVVAWVRTRAGESLTEEEVRQFCQGRIAHFKIPRSVRFVDAFPLTVTGKIQKFRMREMEIEWQGDAAANIRTA
ncbi:MAG TPA: AMP-binding protein [Bryobacteraceae bacterium]|nr:AMP-binding protein [Bryobacteraceae bacterium]